MKHILFVNRDPALAQSLTRILGGSPYGWEVDAVFSSAKALELLPQKPYDALVCWLHTSDLSGLQVMRAAGDICPQAVRIALCANLGKELAIEASKYAHQVITKPVDVEEIVTIIQRAFTLGAILIQEDLQRVVARLNKLPSLPSLYMAIMEEIQSEQTSVEKIGGIIERDPSMSAKILQIVNSAVFGVKQTITSPVQATSFLGIETIRDLALSMSIFAQFNTQLIKELGLGSLWDHSTTVGIYARTIARLEGQPKNVTGNAFTGGILHDVGKLILAENLPRQYYNALRLATGKNKPICDAERETFGASHASVGAYLLGIWGLPDAVIDAVGYHHAPMMKPVGHFMPLTAVHAANVLDHQIHPRSVQSRGKAMDADYLRRLNLSERVSAWEQACMRNEPQTK